MSNKLMLPVILSGYRPRADGSWSVTLSTNILKKNEKEAIDNMHQQLCCILIKDSDIVKDEVDAFDSVNLEIIDTKQSQSQRLRNVLFRLWEQEGSVGDSKKDYDNRMEQLIAHYKGKLV